MAEVFDGETLAALVRPYAGGGEPRFAPIRSGKHNSSYWVDLAGELLVLRIAPPDDAEPLFYGRRMMRQEPGLHALIRSRTPIPVAEIIAHDFGRELIDRDYLLMAALPGVPLGEAHRLSRTGLARALREVGAHLRALHALSADDCLATHAYGYLGAHRPMAPQPTWLAAFRVMWSKLLDDVAASGCYSEGEARALRELLEAYAGHFERPVEPRLLHMDVWAQNILVVPDGAVTGLLDFDRALWGDPEIEYAVLDYCGVSEPPFWEGYGAERDLSPEAMVRRWFYLLYEVQKYMPLAMRRGDRARAMRTRRQCLALARELGYEG